MSKSRIALLLVVVFSLFGAMGLCAGVVYFARLPDQINAMETIVLGQTSYVPGSTAAMRVLVRNTADQKPIADADVRVQMQSVDSGELVQLFQGKTDSNGSADVNFHVPEGLDPSQTLIVETVSSQGVDRLEQSVTLERDYKILLTTDKPLYQPSQVIHIRALALSTFDRVPADDQTLEFIIADGKGNKVFREKMETSEYGIASVDFQLASEVNTGPYKITAQLGNTSSEKTVNVERYVLPKFKVSWNTDRSFYKPGERVTGSIDAEYFFGKKVSGGGVEIDGFTFDFERQDVFTIQGETDEDGAFEFEFFLPDYILGSDLEGGTGRFYLEASVTDLAKHTESSSFSMPVSQSTLIVDVIPESGMIRPGVENILYILTSYPDGTPAETSLTLTISGQSVSLKTGPFGLAEYALTPESSWLEMQIVARDEQGNVTESYVYLEGEWSEETVLLRPDKAAYQVGETMFLEILTTSPSGDAYLDIVREGQTVSTRTVEIEDGRSVVAVDLSPDLYGTLELHAYKILSWGGITRDTRLVIVDSPSDLELTITPDLETHRPGDIANINFQVSGTDGVGAQSAFGIAIVDESVFALAEQDPGFAKLYFLLEAELLQPKYDIHGFSIPDLVGPIQIEPDLQQAVEGAAQASMADAAAFINPFTLSLNSRELKVQQARERQTAFFNIVAQSLFALEILVSITIAGLMLYSVIKDKAASGAATIMLAFVLIFTLLFFLIPTPDWVGSQPLDRLGFFLEQLTYGGEWLLVLLGLGGIIAFIALGIIAIVKKDGALGAAMLLTILVIPIMGVLVFTTTMSGLNPTDKVLILGMLAFTLIPLAYVLRAAGFGADRQIGRGMAALFAAPAVFVGLLIPLLAMNFGGGFAAGAPMMEGEMRDFAAVGEMQAFAPMEINAEMDEAQKMGADGEALAGTPGQPPRLRQFFPETMFWAPEVITDPGGHLKLEIPMADSITTWRLTALASTQDGRLGAKTIGLRVFQDFFIDLDLPLALTQNDEISVPVGVFNYLPDPQEVRLVIEDADWFELLDSSEKTMSIGGNDIDVVYFRIRAKEFGRKALKVTAIGSQQSDAIQKEVTVYPDGKEITFSISDRLPENGVSQDIEIPASSIRGTQRLNVKIYPGVVSQIVEGLDSILRMPYGCFEQTSSTTYPNVLALDYLKTTGQVAPEVQFKAEDYINLGYQRLTTFEVSGGGFSLFGGPPADRMLTAYGLQEFSDMSEVYQVDRAIIERAAEWLLGQQSGDGSWESDQGLVHENTWQNLQNDRLPVTAYVVWSLIEAGYYDDGRVVSGLDYIKENYVQADDPYVVTLVANALVAADLQEGEISSFTEGVLDELASMAQYDGDAAFWSSDVATFMGSEGQTGSIETTGLGAFALLRANRHPEIANAALTYLVRQKDSFGTWHSTQATVMALKAMLESVKVGAEDVNAIVTVSLNGGQSRTLSIHPENFDVVQLVSFDDISPGGQNQVVIEVDGKGELMYQISGAYYLPWADAIAQGDIGEGELVSINVHYDRTELHVDDTVQVDVSVELNKDGRAEWALIDLGIPPGFSVKTEDLSALVNRYQDVPEDYGLPTVERFELTGRQVLVYIGGLSHGNPLSFSYRLQAKFPIVAQTPASSVYDYYNPDVNGEQAPIAIVVNP